MFPIVLIPIYGVPRSFLIHSYSLIGLLSKTLEQPQPAEELYGRPRSGSNPGANGGEEVLYKKFH